MQETEEEVQITPKIIKILTGQFDLESVRILKLNNLYIRRIETVHFCNNLEHLNLSNNNIRNIEGIEGLIQLKYLDLSFNQIEHLANIDTLKNLRILNMKHNQLDTIEELKILILFPLLQDVNFQQNPICKIPNYYNIIRDYIPHISIIDDEHKALRVILSNEHNKPIDLSKADIDPEIYSPWTITSKGENIFKEKISRQSEMDQKFESERNRFQSQILECQKLLSKADSCI